MALAKYISLAILAGMLGCGQPNASQSLLQQSELPASHTSTASLGRAYHTARDKILNVECVTGESTMRAGTKSEIRYSKDMSFEDALNTLSGRAGLGFTYNIVKVGADANIAKRWGHSKLTETHTVSWVATPMVEVFKLSSLALSDRGKEFAQNSSSKLEEKCGDEFIAEIHRGAMIMANLRVDFLNDQDKLEAGGKLGVDLPASMVSVSGDLSHVDQKVLDRATLSFEVVQKGGDPEKLGQILPQSLVSCTLAKPEPCLEAFSNTLRYMNSSFSEQLKDPSKYNPIKFVSESYAESGLSELVPPQGYSKIAPLVEQKRLQLEALLVKNIQDQQRAFTLRSNLSAYLDQDKYDRIYEIEKLTMRNARLLSDAYDACFSQPADACIDKAGATVGALEMFDARELEVSIAPQQIKEAEPVPHVCEPQRALDPNGMKIAGVDLLSFYKVEQATAVDSPIYQIVAGQHAIHDVKYFYRFDPLQNKLYCITPYQSSLRISDLGTALQGVRSFKKNPLWTLALYESKEAQGRKALFESGIDRGPTAYAAGECGLISSLWKAECKGKSGTLWESMPSVQSFVLSLEEKKSERPNADKDVFADPNWMDP